MHYIYIWKNFACIKPVFNCNGCCKNHLSPSVLSYRRKTRDKLKNINLYKNRLAITKCWLDIVLLNLDGTNVRTLKKTKTKKNKKQLLSGKGKGWESFIAKMSSN